MVGSGWGPMRNVMHGATCCSHCDCTVHSPWIAEGNNAATWRLHLLEHYSIQHESSLHTCTYASNRRFAAPLEPTIVPVLVGCPIAVLSPHALHAADMKALHCCGWLGHPPAHTSGCVRDQVSIYACTGVSIAGTQRR